MYKMHMYVQIQDNMCCSCYRVGITWPESYKEVVRTRGVTKRVSLSVLSPRGAARRRDGLGDILLKRLSETRDFKRFTLDKPNSNNNRSVLSIYYKIHLAIY